MTEIEKILRFTTVDEVKHKRDELYKSEVEIIHRQINALQLIYSKLPDDQKMTSPEPDDFFDWVDEVDCVKQNN